MESSWTIRNSYLLALPLWLCICVFKDPGRIQRPPQPPPLTVLPRVHTSGEGHYDQAALFLLLCHILS